MCAGIKGVCHYSQPHFFLIVHVYAHERVIVCMWSSEDTLQELVLFYSLWGQGIEQLGCQQELLPLSHVIVKK